ncbi:hypothetical protein [Microbulbifer sp. S227A]|uniref:hypothetical protein n=1 Tax=Microbulbifer sp. S227A TaxID=3415131 RepID=UPI003C7A1B5D
MSPFLAWSERHPNIKTIRYSSAEEFAELAFDALDNQLSGQHLTAQPRADETHVDRTSALRGLEKRARPGRTVILTGPDGCGLSWIAGRWVSRAGQSHLFDGRRESFETHNGLRRARASTRGAIARLWRWLWGRLTGLLPASRQRRSVFDHFEFGFRTPDHAMLGLFEAAADPRVSRVVVTRHKRLLGEAERLGWPIVHVPAPARAESLAFSAAYLAEFGKALEPEQLDALGAAPWLTDIRLNRIVLDELRRFGSIEELSQRLRALLALPSHREVLGDILDGFRSALPQDWAHAIAPMLVSLGFSLRGLSELNCRQLAALSVGRPPSEPLPPHLWTAFRQAFGAAMCDQQGRVDIGSAASLAFVSDLAEADASTRQRAVAAFSSWLAYAAPGQKAREAPRFALNTGGVDGLARCLQDIDVTRSVLEQGETFIEGWLETLPEPLQHETMARWCAADTADVFLPHQALALGLLCLRVSARRTGAVLLERAAQSDHTSAMAEISLALIDKDSQRLGRAVQDTDWTDADPAPEHIAFAVFALSAIAEGLVEIEGATFRDILRATPRWARRVPTDIAAQLWHLSGQICFEFSALRRAERCFKEAEKLCRHSGNAHALVLAIERRSAACLELNAFRQARASAADARDLARRMGFLRLEGLAFERQIETEIRTARLLDADQLAQDYLDRARSGVGSMDRAKDLYDEVYQASL